MQPGLYKFRARVTDVDPIAETHSAVILDRDGNRTEATIQNALSTERLFDVGETCFVSIFTNLGYVLSDGKSRELDAELAIQEDDTRALAAQIPKNPTTPLLHRLKGYARPGSSSERWLDATIRRHHGRFN